MVNVPVITAPVPVTVVKMMSPLLSVTPQDATVVTGTLPTVNWAVTCPNAATERAKNITAAIRIFVFIYNFSFAKRGEALRLTGFQH
jgi:hypothetical protein